MTLAALPTSPAPAAAASLSLAQQVDTLLATLAGELETRNHPHRIALRGLGINRNGATAVPYNDEAFTIWSELLARNAEDFKARHHLAIMYHARALDREMGPNPAEANPDWEAALQCWSELSGSEAFWNDLGTRAWGEGQPHSVGEIRKAWALDLLQVHYDIAFDPATKRFRAAYHMRLAQHASFAEEVRREVRNRTYARFICTVDSAVWQPDLLSPDLIDFALKRIQEFLQIDPECETAAIDALRLLVKLLNAWGQQLGALPEDDPGRDQIFRLVQQTANQWNPFLQQVRHIVHKSDPDVRQKLRQWHRIMGDVHRNLKKYAEAVRFYEQAHQLSLKQDEQKKLAEVICVTRALEARDYAASGETEDKSWGKRLCDELVRDHREDLSVHACFILANAYEVLPEFDTAEELCRRGLALEPDVEDLEESRTFQGLLQEVQERIAKGRRGGRVNALVEEATALIDETEFMLATQKLDRALQLDPEDGPALFHRCQCHLEMLRPDLAERDLEDFRRVAEAEAGEARQAMLGAVSRLEQRSRVLQEEIECFGTEALRLRRLAQKETSDKKFDAAEPLLRQAIAEASSAGLQMLQSELASILNARAVKEVESVSKRTFTAPDERVEAYRRAQDWLEEAVTLWPENTQMATNLRTVQRDLNGLLHR